MAFLTVLMGSIVFRRGSVDIAISSSNENWETMGDNACLAILPVAMDILMNSFHSADDRFFPPNSLIWEIAQLDDLHDWMRWRNRFLLFSRVAFWIRNCHEFHETCHSITFYFMKKDSKRCCETTTPESIHTKDESKRGSAFAFIFGVNWPVQWM